MAALAVALASGTAWARSSRAAETDPAAAEVLFQEARELMKQGKFDDACPRFMESERLDPATGTLIAVAACHERQGLLATAWAEFTEAAGRARSEGRQDRVVVATRRAEALRPLLSAITVQVSSNLLSIEGLKIRRGELELGPATWNRAMPIDGGTHRFQASAPGFQSDEVVVEVPRERGSVIARMPELIPEAALPESPPAAAIEASPAPEPVEPSAIRAEPVLPVANPYRDAPRGSNRRTVAVVVAAAGGVSLLASGYALGGALRRKSVAGRYCDGTRCFDSDGVRLLHEATQWGNVATGLAITGALLGATGLTLYLMDGEAGREAAGTTNRMQLAVELRGSAAVLRGRF